MSENGGSTVDTYRCKACLDDPDLRVSEAERFRLETAEDYADVLRHFLTEHPDSPELSEVLKDLQLTTPCSQCHEPFISPVHVSDHGLFVRSICDECADSDVESLIFRKVDVHEVLPMITEGVDGE